MKKILLLLIICLGNTINVFSATPIDEYSENYCFLFEGKEHGAIASKTGSYCPVVGVFPRTHPHSWKWRNSLIEAYVTLKLSVTPFGTTKSIIVLDSYVRYLQTEKTSDGIKKEIIEMLRQRSRPYLFSNSGVNHAMAGPDCNVNARLSNVLISSLDDNIVMELSATSAVGFNASLCIK